VTQDVSGVGASRLFGGGTSAPAGVESDTTTPNPTSKAAANRKTPEDLMEGDPT
jgi:hypothetical protein